MREITISTIAVIIPGTSGCGNSPVRTITVQGEGRVTVIPNQVEMTVNIEFVRDRMNNAIAETKQVMKEFLALCEKYYIGKTDIKGTLKTIHILIN